MVKRTITQELNWYDFVKKKGTKSHVKKKKKIYSHKAIT